MSVLIAALAFSAVLTAWVWPDRILSSLVTMSAAGVLLGLEAVNREPDRRSAGRVAVDQTRRRG